MTSEASKNVLQAIGKVPSSWNAIGERAEGQHGCCVCLQLVGNGSSC